MRQSLLTSVALKAIVPLALLAAPMAAQAASFTFTGTGSSGVDPLGGTWEAGPNVFGLPQFDEPLVNNQFPTFKGGQGLQFATSIIFTYTGSAPNPFNLDRGAGVTHVASPQGSSWDTTFLSPTSVMFTAEGDDRLNIGDTFSLQIGFDKAITDQNFSFTQTWSDGLATGAVPEPASWALMIGGMGLVGATMRRRRQVLAAA